MSELKYWVFPRIEVDRLMAHRPIPQSFLATWESIRPGVLDDDRQDLFSALNSRAHRHVNPRFDLFQQVTTVDGCDFAVCMNWCELFLASGVPQNIPTLIDAVLDAAKGKPTVLSWNHDIPSDDMPQLQSLPSNVLVLNYNCRKPNANDFCVPFWNVTANMPPNDNANRTYRASFIGQCAGELRRRLRYAFQQRPGYYFSEDRRPEPEYLAVMRDSWFILCPRGGGLSSYRLFESLQQESIPVLFADDYSLPFPDLDWRSFCVRIPERFAGDLGAIETVIDAVDRDAMLVALRTVKQEFGLGGVQTRIHRHIRGMLT